MLTIANLMKIIAQSPKSREFSTVSRHQLTSWVSAFDKLAMVVRDLWNLHSFYRAGRDARDYASCLQLERVGLGVGRLMQLHKRPFEGFLSRDSNLCTVIIPLRPALYLTINRVPAFSERQTSNF